MLIDCDAHISTPDCFKLVKDKIFNERYLAHYIKTGNLKTISQQKKEAESLGVTHQIINLFGTNTGLNYHLNKENAVDAMQVYNNSMSKLIKQGDGFFSATGWLAMQDIKASLSEIDRIKKLGLFAVYIDDTIAWGRAKWAKTIFKKCNDLDIPIYIHFTKFDHHIDNKLPQINDKDLVEKINKKRWKTQCKLGQINPFLVMFYSLFECGWLNEFKNLKLIVAERGLDWIKPITKFMDDSLHINSLSIIKKHFWFTTEPEDKRFKDDADYIGWDKVLFASDHGHSADCGGANFGKDLKTIKKLNLTQEQYENITFKNFLKLKK